MARSRKDSGRHAGLAVKKNGPGLIRRPIVPILSLSDRAAAVGSRGRSPPDVWAGPQEEPDECQSTMSMSFRV
jgi:hypothetical protein